MGGEKKELSRKEFLSLSAAVAGAGIVSAAEKAQAGEKKKAKWAMVMDARRCIGCHACTVACKAENEVPLGVWRTHIRAYEKGRYPHTRRFFFQWICNHCGNCATVSQGSGLGSFYRRDDGIVLFDYKKLQGKTPAEIKAEADLVISSCPVEAIYINPFTGFPEKCTFCIHRVEKGLVPACVQTCIPRARVFGDLSDPNSVVSRLVATNPMQKLCPDGNVYYFGAEGELIDTLKGGRQIAPEDFEKGILTQYI